MLFSKRLRNAHSKNLLKLSSESADSKFYDLFVFGIIQKKQYEFEFLWSNTSVILKFKT